MCIRDRATPEEVRLGLEVERLKEALRKKEKENEDLIDRLREMEEGMHEREKQMEMRMEARMDDILNKRFAKEIGTKGTRMKVTSTPKIVDLQKGQSVLDEDQIVSDVDEKDMDKEKM